MKKLTWLLVPYFALLWYLSSFQEVITGDGYYYCVWTVNSVFPVVYPALIWLFRPVIPDPQVAGTIVSMLAMCGNVLLVYLLAKRFMSDRWAFVTAVLFALTPISLRSGVLVMSEATYLFFVLLSFYYFERKHLLFGLFSALAFLTRPEAIVFFSALVVYRFIKHREIAEIAWMVGTFLTVVLLSSTSLWIAGGDFALTRKVTLLSGMDSFPKLVEECEFASMGFGWPLIILFLIAAWKQPNFLLIGLLQFAIFPLFSGLSGTWRFVFPYLPFILIITTAYLANIRWVDAFVGVTLIVVSFFLTRDHVIRPDEPYLELKYAGLALKPYVNEQTVLMGKKSCTAFYAGLATAQFVHIPNNVSLAELYRQAKGVTHIVVSLRATAFFHPQLLRLFNPAVKLEGGFELFARLYPGTDYEILIFRRENK